MDVDMEKMAYTALGGALLVGAALAFGGGSSKKEFLSSVEVPGSEEEGLGVVHRHPDYMDKLLNVDDNGTLLDLFKAGMKQSGDNPCLGKRRIVGTDAKGKPKAGEFMWQSYNEVWERIQNFASGLENLDLIPVIPGTKMTGPMRLISILVKNCPEWTICEFAAYRQGASTVPLYDTLGPETVEMVINETELTTVLAPPDAIDKMLKVKAHSPTLKNIVFTDDISEDDKEKLEGAGLAVFTFAEVEASGADYPHDETPGKADSVSTFCYTSGTTGKSKGAVLTHRNLMATALSAQASVHMVPGSKHLSYLPLAHVFERCVLLLVLSVGGRVGYYQGETAKIAEDISALRPTVFPSVPRLLNKFYDKVMAGATAGGGLKAKMFDMAFKAKQEGLKNGQYTHALWDRLIFKKVAAKIGLNECSVAVTGSAPIAPHVIEFLRILLSCPVVEGYGQTETSAASTAQHPLDTSSGNVGGPLPCAEIRLASVPEMGYLVTDTIHGKDEARGQPGIPCKGRGEIWIRGSGGFLGYYKMEEKSAEALRDDGWIMTGDIGIWLPEGQLKIVDRKKNIFKLAQGEYIAPEKIENVYGKSALIAQVFVYGDSFQHQLVAVVVPDPEGLMPWAKANGVSGTFEELCAKPEVSEAIHKEMDTLRRAAKLCGFEHAAKIKIDATPFSMENDLLTPTFKLKRDQAKKYYQDDIDAMYHDLGGVAGVKGLKQ